MVGGILAVLSVATLFVIVLTGLVGSIIATTSPTAILGAELL